MDARAAFNALPSGQKPPYPLQYGNKSRTCIAKTRFIHRRTNPIVHKLNVVVGINKSRFKTLREMRLRIYVRVNIFVLDEDQETFMHDNNTQNSKQQNSK